ncbi:response regulator [Haloferax mediterranei ATCC 33500]|uniref:Chemotaxis protein CheY n=1 Tax=Haloferax mediterranei (strain ATCC 33500 / DSM 1411 / JCM 8866 / NBRC 14739 / NCIMB 2177 / R-4) TaxID=523841 RepID=I3R8U2_HALMT|nr:response regulator [Haloferax mediterranei]AFK20652.1 response regulator receiver [Haloferax mediterranei ATCC 33500]AHZ22863.1 chemotaxis protein CheY [Haloferax mediterranei ATCC 33500]EMA03028.1 response regulator receiver [Haloferax mediterranei ATCC 33500]MDX5987791.1 response regulator [Haloferax mediterranei ATCC 33500]QCQ74269.1 response regulator [Haloferax mediterranei ATCC 33500]
MTSEKNEPIEILLVEDNPGDVRLTKKGLQQGKVTNHLYVVRDGVEAMSFLRQEGEYADAPRPDLILLDLNMPKMDGKEVLQEIKTDPDLKRIPVVVLTSSDAEEDIAKSYDLHANAYLTKPVDFDGFLEIVRSIEEFWFTVVKYPPSNTRK